MDNEYFLHALFFVIASERRERGNQQARNPNTFDCHEAKPLAMTQSNLSGDPTRLLAALAMTHGNLHVPTCLPPSPPDNAASAAAMAAAEIS